VRDNDGLNHSSTSPHAKSRPSSPEHTDEVLRELGIGEHELLDLKFDGAIA
jgi:hypothetical protein